MCMNTRHLVHAPAADPCVMSLLCSPACSGEMGWRRLKIEDLNDSMRVSAYGTNPPEATLRRLKDLGWVLVGTCFACDYCNPAVGELPVSSGWQGRAGPRADGSRRGQWGAAVG